MRILVSSDGTDTLTRAVDYAVLFAGAAQVTLLSAYKDEQERALALALHEGLTSKLEEHVQTEARSRLIQGSPAPVVAQEIEEGEYDLLVFGVHLGRSLTRLRPKQAALELAQHVSIPVLTVFPSWEKLEQILVWSAGQEPDRLALRLAARLARRVGAKVTVLHVMSQVPLRADAEVADLEDDAQSLMERETHEGELLEQALRILKRAGVPASGREVKIRHGLTLDEIIAESEEGEYDLVVIGAVEAAAGESWPELRELVQQDLAERVLKAAKRPVMIAREPSGGLDWSEL